MRNTIFEEDRLLAKVAGTPSENKPRFDWAEALDDNRFEIPKVRITDGAGDREPRLAVSFRQTVGRQSKQLWGQG